MEQKFNKQTDDKRQLQNGNWHQEKRLLWFGDAKYPGMQVGFDKKGQWRIEMSRTQFRVWFAYVGH